MSCTVRVQLPGDPTESEYAQLHTAMAMEGFSRTITSGDGDVYDLPHAEYNYGRVADKSKVLDLAKNAAESVGYSSAKIFVTASNGRTWSNLKKR